MTTKQQKSEAAAADPPVGSQSQPTPAGGKCIRCDRELSVTEVRHERAVCDACLERKGRVADLEVAILAPGDTPHRISHWPDIFSLLTLKYGSRPDVKPLLDRSTFIADENGRRRLERELYVLLWRACTVDLRDAATDGNAHLLWTTTDFIDWLKSTAPVDDGDWLPADSPSQIATQLGTTLTTLKRWRAQGVVRIDVVTQKRWRLHRGDATKIGG